MRNRLPATLRRILWASGTLASIALALLSGDASALPLFARQTGQNCLACHAGGQFPELTPYGRMFKMTGYTIGERTKVPLSVMGVLTAARVADTSKSDAPQDDFQKNGVPQFATGSLFLGGKVTDNIGAFAQVTYDNYFTNSKGYFQGHSNADNIDLRYADRFVDNQRDVVFGLSVNNNPSVSDPWNSAPAWMQYVPASSTTSHQFADPNSPYPGFGSGGNVAGVSAYVFWNKTLYAELGTYTTANRGFSFMSAGIEDAATTKLKGGNNPYWRLALSHEWGAQNIMVGATGMTAHVFDGTTDPSDSGAYNRIRNTGVDAQYQYLLDPHTITAQVAYMRQVTDYSANTLAGASSFVQSDGATPVAAFNPSDTTNIFRAKLSYVYQAKYGGSLSYFNLRGTTNTLNQSSGFDPCFAAGAPGAGSAPISTDADATQGCAPSTRVTGNLSGNPATNGMTYEVFWLPVQYVRVGAQYTAYHKFNGATDNYDGFGRNARDNNTLFLYVWGAY